MKLTLLFTSLSYFAATPSALQMNASPNNNKLNPNNDKNKNKNFVVNNARRNFVSQSIGAGIMAAGVTLLAEEPVLAETTAPLEGGVTVQKLKSGLQFIDIKEGTGPSPQYGQLVSIKYTAYMKLPSKGKEKQKFDSDVYLTKHGNGKMIAGLDQGLHTMKVGGTRRLIIPPKLGFTDLGLGPVPQSPFSRLQLNRMLEEMVKVRGGNLIYDVELVRVVDDEADQGYYDDASLTQEQFDTLRDNIQRQARDKRGLPQVGNGDDDA